MIYIVIVMYSIVDTYIIVIHIILSILILWLLKGQIKTNHAIKNEDLNIFLILNA